MLPGFSPDGWMEDDSDRPDAAARGLAIALGGSMLLWAESPGLCSRRACM
jgi:hypothetical protein